MRLPIAILSAVCSVTIAACSSGSTGGGGSGGAGALPQISSAEAAIPAQIEGFEIQKVPADQVPEPPAIAGQAATEAAFAVVLGTSEDAYRIVAFRTAQDPAQVSEADRLAVVGEEGARVDPASGRDVTIDGVAARCYDTDDFGDTTKPDTICIYVDGPNIVYVLTQDQGAGGGEEFTRRVIAARRGA